MNGFNLPAKLGRVLVTVLDVLFFVALLILLLAWLFNPLKWNISSAHLTIHCDWKPVVAPVELLAARYLIRRRLHPHPAGLLE